MMTRLTARHQTATPARRIDGRPATMAESGRRAAAQQAARLYVQRCSASGAARLFGQKSWPRWYARSAGYRLVARGLWRGDAVFARPGRGREGLYRNGTARVAIQHRRR